MYTYVTKTNFVDAFKLGKTNILKNKFSYEGLQVLYEHYTLLDDECSPDSDAGMEFEPTVIAQAWSEYESLEQYNDDYGSEYETLEDLQYYTMALPYVKTWLSSKPNSYDGFVVLNS